MVNFENISVVDNHTIATPAQRITAGVIDLLVYAVIALVLGVVFGLFGLSGIGEIIALSYLFFRDSLKGLGHQSVGKKIVGLKVLHKEEVPVSYLDGIRRNFLFLPNLLGLWIAYTVGGITLLLILIELYQLYTSDNNQRLGDRFANTIVVQQHGR